MRPIRIAAVVAGTSAAALLAQGLIETAVSRSMERDLRTAAHKAGVSVAAVSVAYDGWRGQATIRDLRLKGRNGADLSLGRVTLPAPGLMSAFVTPAQAQSAITFDNIALDFGVVKFSVPRIDVEGSTASRADLVALFDFQSAVPYAQRVQRISASLIRIPAVNFQVNTPELEQAFSYRDVRLENIAAGKVGRVTAAGADVTQKVGPNATDEAKKLLEQTALNGTYGAMTIETIDLPVIARFITESAKGANEPFALAMGDSTIQPSKLSGPAMSMEIGTARGGALRLRPPEIALIELINMAQAAPKIDEMPPADRERFTRGIVSVINSIEIGRGVADGVKMNVSPALNGGGSFNMGTIISGPFSNSTVGEFSMANVQLTAPGMKASFDKLGVERMSFTTLMQTLARTGGDLDGADPRDTLPEVGRIIVSGIDIDGFGSMAADQPQKMKLGLFEVVSAGHLRGVPTSLGVTINNLVLEIPSATTDSGLRTLIDLGYPRVDWSAKLDLAWTEATRTLSLRDLSWTGAGMGRLALKGDVHNIAKEVFTGDLQVATIAAFAMQARSLDFVFENNGLIDKLIEMQAKQQRRSPAAVRTEFGGMAQMILPGLLNNHPSAPAVAQAVSTFINQPKRLEINVRGKGVGLTAADLIAAPNPQDLLQKVDIRAKAN
jgi:hypothetical protein